MEFSRGDGGASSGSKHHDASTSHRKKGRFQRYTAYQTQRLEEAFKECTHPDVKARKLLSRELGLQPRQIKFWYQNKRTQIKVQNERAELPALRAENIKLKEALNNSICPSCGGPSRSEGAYSDEQILRIENAKLRKELDRVSIIASKYIGRPVSQLPPMRPIDLSSLGTSIMSISDVDKIFMDDIATDAMDELIILLQNDELWMKSTANGREILNPASSESISSTHNSQFKNLNIRVEASRDSGVVIMNSLALVDMFMDANMWMELFPTIVPRARTIEVISSEMLGSQSGKLQLMYEEVQVLSPLVPTRQFYFLRFCKQIEQGWAIVDVSYDIQPQESQILSLCKAHKHPSGCLIQNMPNGHSKVTWVEHWGVEDKAPIDMLYRELIQSGIAFGAERWLSTLQRTSERFAWSARNLGGVIPSPEGNASVMRLAQRMVSTFCSAINPCNAQTWTTLLGLNEFEIHATVHKSTDPAQPNEDIISATATVWLSIPPENVFDFLRDERNRPQWDVLANGRPVQQVARIESGSNPGNCISVLEIIDASQNDMLILQESCVDSSGSLVVYCPICLPVLNHAMSGQDSSNIPLLPSGFTISPDGRSSSGSLMTLMFQMLVGGLPSARMSPESVMFLNELITTTVHQIKAALNALLPEAPID
ncbi:hypothetical protein BUALT_BualtUnG0011600 [Buddleja alternifolia]|uniref:Uncharacterized protein n=1 Tax=Buddleja alternifolia TaxID=168488 RepID=A0AAV6W0P7_9LAMI|nr:hypothetical protein BUALT_BualtUnG0011600 [Buddleja alternifolia]